MAANDLDAEVLLFDQTYFALDARIFVGFQEMLDNPLSTSRDADVPGARFDQVRRGTVEGLPQRP